MVFQNLKKSKILLNCINSKPLPSMGDRLHWLFIFHCSKYFRFGGIRICIRVSTIDSDLMFLWIFFNSCPLNLLLVQSHWAEITIILYSILSKDATTWVGCELNRDYGIRVIVKQCPHLLGNTAKASSCHLPTCYNTWCRWKYHSLLI